MTQEKSGRLKLFLGFAAGVGKTYEMLAEANRRKHERGQDVVIGYVVTHKRPDTEAQIGDLETIPRRTMDYKGSAFEEMDTAAILARRPDWVLGKADEIVTVDISPRTLINRLQRGDVYPKEKIPQALENFFTEGNLSALREIALREVASEVDRSVQDYREGRQGSPPWHTQERVMVCISPDKTSERLLRRGWRISRRLRADLVAVYVPLGKPTLNQQKVLEIDFSLAERLGIKIERAEGSSIAAALAKYARTNQVTQIIIGHSGRSRWQEFLQGSIVTQLVRLVRGIDVLIVANSVPTEP